MTKKGGKSGKKEVKPPSPGTVVYKGPIIQPKDKDEARSQLVTLNFTGLLSSTAGGVIDTNYGNDPNSYGLTDWTNIVALWHEYRTLGFRVEFHPHNRYSKTTVVCTPLITAIDRVSSAALGSYQGAMSHESATKHSLEDPWIREVRMADIESSVFSSTAASIATYWMKFYADGLSVSTAYGRMFVYILLEVRGRK